MNKFVILLFHSVDDKERLSLKNLGNIHPDLFEKSLISLKKEFDIVNLKEIIESISGERDCKDRLLAVTFDDGTSSYAANAVPIMRSHGIPSTCFLITGCVDDKALYWRYLYNFCINTGKADKLSYIIESEYKMRVSADDIINFTRKEYDTEKNRRILKRIFKEIVSENDYRNREGRLFLTLKEIKSLKKNSLVSFGIHTHTHPVMIKLDDTVLDDEISKSLNFYKNNIEKETPMLSIPFGRLYKDYDERTIISAKKLSIEVMLSAYGGYNKLEQPLYNIQRIPVNEEMLKNGIASFVRSLNNIKKPVEYTDKEENLASKII